jgi:hypothetical protein
MKTVIVMSYIYLFLTTLDTNRSLLVVIEYSYSVTFCSANDHVHIILLLEIC